MKRRVLFILFMVILVGCTAPEQTIFEASSDTNVQLETENIVEKTVTKDSNKMECLGDLCNCDNCLEWCNSNGNGKECDLYCLEHPDNEFCQEHFTFLYDRSNTEIENLEEQNEALKRITNKDCSNFYFKNYIVDPAKIKTISPLGSVHGSGKHIVDRTYVHLSEEADIIAPTDMVLIAGRVDDSEFFEKYGYVDYTMEFDIGCGMTLALDHISTVPAKIKERLVPVADSQGWPSVEPLFIEEGELIGTRLYDFGSAGMDIIIDDLRFQNKFVTQKRYLRSNLLHAICPFNMYKDDMKEAYLSKIGGGGGTPFVDKGCKSTSRDVIGTIEGQWFLNEEPTPDDMQWYEREDGFTSPFPIIGDEERITIGRINGVEKRWIYPDDSTYKDPKEVTDSHCYRDENGWIYFKMLGDNKMEVAFSQRGSCPARFPGGVKYYR